MKAHLPRDKGHDQLLWAHSDSGKTLVWDLKIQAWVSVMQPPRAAGNFRINGKEWKHTAQKFLAQDCSSRLSAPVNLWHCPSCLQSLTDVVLSDQPECLWLTFAMELLALTLTGVLYSSEKYWALCRFLKDRLHRLKNHFVLLVGFKHVHRLILSRFYSDKSVLLFIPLLSKVKATCCGKTAAIIIHQPWAHINWIWIIPWGTSRVKYVGMVYLFLCLSSKSDLTSQQLCGFKMCHPEKFHIFPHISHYCEVHASQSTYWMSIWEHSWLLSFCCVSGSQSRYCYYKTTVWAEHVSARGGTPLDNTCKRISVLVGK